MTKKTAQQQLDANKQPKKVKLDKDFAGIKQGQMMYVATPKLIDHYINTIPYGETSSIVALRNGLAIANGCDATCPVSTAIFIRISAQAAIDQLEAGKPVEVVTPFWRVLSSEDKITQKLSIDAAWLDHQREMEKS